MATIDQLEASLAHFREQGRRLAGELHDLAQRAATYHHLYEHSGRNFVFPLIAAHGALWAKGYFNFGRQLGRCCACQYPFSRGIRSELLRQLEDFADAFRDINRRVCVETYAAYHFAAAFGDQPAATQLVPPELLQSLNRCHHANRHGSELNTAEKRAVFESFFRHEQLTVVGPAIEAATAKFRWPLMKWLAFRPRIRFAYFPPGRSLQFRNFALRSERIERGLRAFDIAAEVGWKTVEAALRDYNVLPAAFFANSTRHFQHVRQAALAGV